MNKIKRGPYISSHKSWQGHIRNMEHFGKTLTQFAHLQSLQVTYIDRSPSTRIRLNNIACHIEAWSFIAYKILCNMQTRNPSLLFYCYRNNQKLFLPPTPSKKKKKQRCNPRHKMCTFTCLFMWYDSYCKEHRTSLKSTMEANNEVRLASNI